jgi:hypothetical protein
VPSLRPTYSATPHQIVHFTTSMLALPESLKLLLGLRHRLRPQYLRSATSDSPNAEQVDFLDEETRSQCPAKRASGPLGRSAWLWKHVTSFAWWWEFGSITVSGIALALIVVTLGVMDGRSLDAWKLPIQINSLISICSTLSRSALLLVVTEGMSQLKWNFFEKHGGTLDKLQSFDDASRGPWGAFLLIFRTRPWRNVLAILGAFLTVIALAFEPFTQQVLEFPSRTATLTNGTAEFWIAENFSLPNSVFDGTSDPRRVAVDMLTVS